MGMNLSHTLAYLSSFASFKLVSDHSGPIPKTDVTVSGFLRDGTPRTCLFTYDHRPGEDCVPESFLDMVRRTIEPEDLHRAPLAPPADDELEARAMRVSLDNLEIVRAQRDALADSIRQLRPAVDAFTQACVDLNKRLEALKLPEELPVSPTV